MLVTVTVAWSFVARIGRFTTQDEIDYVLGKVRHQVERLRELSPLWDMYKEGIDLKSVQWVAH